MPKTKETIKLKCGYDATIHRSSKVEMISIGLYPLYRGKATFKEMASLFQELDEMGYVNDGITIETGYYDSIDDLTLEAHKMTIKNTPHAKERR